MKKTQCDRVLDYMKQFGSISSMEAFRDLGITRLAAVIYDIEHKGISVNRTPENGLNSFNEKTTFTRYSLPA